MRFGQRITPSVSATTLGLGPGAGQGVRTFIFSPGLASSQAGNSTAGQAIGFAPATCPRRRLGAFRGPA